MATTFLACGHAAQEPSREAPSLRGPLLLLFSLALSHRFVMKPS